jgi:S1-C subfamily serine protease
VFSAGFPSGLTSGAWGSAPTVTFNSGRVVSSNTSAPVLDAVQVDADIHPGNSGGPVVDGDGVLVGVALAHRKGSGTSFIITSEMLAQFLEEQEVPVVWSPPGSPSEPQPVPVASEGAVARAAAATALVLADGRWGPGLVLESSLESSPGASKDRLLVLSRYSVAYDTSRPHRSRPSRIQIALRPGTKEARTFRGELLRASESEGLALFAIPRPSDAPEPPPLGAAVMLAETAPVELVGLREPWRGNQLDLAAASFQQRHGAVASREFGGPSVGLSVLNVNAGPGNGFMASVALDASGAVVGLATATSSSEEEGPSLTSLIPAERIRAFLGGDIKGVAARYVSDGLGHCYVELNAELDDPLHAVERVGVTVSETAGLDALGLGMGPPGAQVMQKAVEGGSPSVILEVRPDKCPRVLGFQLFLEGQGRRRTRDAWRALPLLMSPVDVQSQVYEASSPGADQPVDFKKYLGTRMVPPKGWTPACEPSEPDSCARACAGGDLRGCFVQALGVRNHGPMYNAIQLPPMRRACEGNVGQACLLLGFAHENLRGREKQEATRYFDIACANGVGTGCLKVGVERQGSGDLDGAARAFRRGCEYLDGESCYKLAEAYQRGMGVPVEAQTAASYFLRSCQNWYPAGCVNLARAYEEGKIGAPEPVFAFRLYSFACNSGVGEACVSVARLSTEGRGTIRDPGQAQAAYRKGCQLRNPDACSALRAGR